MGLGDLFFYHIHRLGKRQALKRQLIKYHKKYELDETFEIIHEGISLYGEGSIAIGENSYLGANTMIQAVEGFSVKIGKNCRVGSNVRIFTLTAVADQDFNNFHSLENKRGNVAIGDAVWLGANVVILPGVAIGENAVVGANAVVVRDVPPRAIVGGVPAKLIRMKTF